MSIMQSGGKMPTMAVFGTGAILGFMLFASLMTAMKFGVGVEYILAGFVLLPAPMTVVGFACCGSTSFGRMLAAYASGAGMIVYGLMGFIIWFIGGYPAYLSGEEDFMVVVSVLSPAISIVGFALVTTVMKERLPEYEAGRGRPRKSRRSMFRVVGKK